MKHFVGFRHGIGQRRIRLEFHRLGVELLAQMMYRVIGNVQFARQARGGLAFTDSAQQENDLDGAQVLVGKERIGIDRIHMLTVSTTIPRQMVAFRLPEEPRMGHTDATSRTMQSFGVKVFR